MFAKAIALKVKRLLRVSNMMFSLLVKHTGIHLPTTVQNARVFIFLVSETYYVRSTDRWALGFETWFAYWSTNLAK